MGNEAVMKAIEKQQWLEELANAAQPAVRELLQQNGELKDLLHGKFLGHPLHPVLTDIPVGAWTVAMVLDAVELVTDSEALGGASDLAVGVGLLGALGSAVTGATDWSETDGRARQIGAMHAILNVAATGFYIASLAARRGKGRKSGIGLSMIGYAIASASAYLGGHLVFGEQIGVDHTATPDRGKPEEWTAVLDEAALPELKPTRVMAGNLAVLLVKRNGTIHALTETCSHLGGPLAEGTIDGEGIRCPWHGSRFCLADGSVMDGPATFRQPTFDVRVTQGKIEVRASK